MLVLLSLLLLLALLLLLSLMFLLSTVGTVAKLINVATVTTVLSLLSLQLSLQSVQKGCEDNTKLSHLQLPGGALFVPILHGAGRENNVVRQIYLPFVKYKWLTFNGFNWNPFFCDSDMLTKPFRFPNSNPCTLECPRKHHLR